ncbi:hypothetical protein ACHAW6_006981 [Cyclotella cf. meneghiniana]
MGYLDQKSQCIRSTKLSSATTTPDPMKEPQQLSLNDKTNIMLMTMVDIQGQVTALRYAYIDVCAYLPVQGYYPQLRKFYNESSHDVDAFITENNVSFQYTPPEIHLTNIAKQAIHSRKYHFVAMCASTAESYHLSNWCKDLEQTDFTLNMMRPCTKTQTSLNMKH